MEAKLKAKELVDKYDSALTYLELKIIAKQCAIIAVENEYNSLREQLFNLISCRVIESENTYLTRLNELIKQEQSVKTEIQNL